MALTNPAFVAMQRALHAAKLKIGPGLLIAASGCIGCPSGTASEVISQDLQLTKQAFLTRLTQACGSTSRWHKREQWRSEHVPGLADRERCLETGRAAAQKCWDDRAPCFDVCSHPIWHNPGGDCAPLTDSRGQRIVIMSDTWFVPGRQQIGGRPPSQLRAAAVTGNAISGWLATMAMLEAASVDAFMQLHGLLRTHRAPAALATRAIVAAADERRHALAMADCARRFGATAIPAYSCSSTPIAVLARENFVHGCLGETYGAAIAAHQWQHANATIATPMRTIATEELSHAALSWDVHAWLQTTPWRLSQAEQVALAHDWATTKADQALTTDVRAVLGLPADDDDQRLRHAIATHAISHVLTPAT